jgi:hypothetical protein
MAGGGGWETVCWECAEELAELEDDDEEHADGRPENVEVEG